MSEFEIIDTQEKFDEAIADRIETEKKAIQQQYEGYLSPEDAEKKYAGYLSPEKVAEKDAKIKGLETAAIKTRVALEMGIPHELASKLSGDNEDDIKKDAEVMAKYLKIHQAAPLADPEGPVKDDKRAAVKKLLSGMEGE